MRGDPALGLCLVSEGIRAAWVMGSDLIAACHGVLFLDELTEFAVHVLDALGFKWRARIHGPRNTSASV